MGVYDSNYEIIESTLYFDTSRIFWIGNATGRRFSSAMDGRGVERRIRALERFSRDRCDGKASHRFIWSNAAWAT
jgi:hypothetical protein